MKVSLSYLLALAIVVLFNFPVSQSARICVVSVVGFMNYRSGYDNLLESLVDKGHEVSVLSTLPLNVRPDYKSRIRYISPKSALSHLDSFFNNVCPLEWRLRGKEHVLWDMLPILTLDLCHLILQDEETLKWLQSVKKYDLFIVDSAWNECGIGLAHVFQAKLILFSVHSNLLSWNLDALGAVSEVSWIPDVQYDTSVAPGSRLSNFLRKAHVTIRSLRWYIYRTSFTFYQIRKCFRKLLKLPEFPSIRELEQNASLVLVNSHYSEEYSRSLPSVFVPVGGIHIRELGSSAFKENQESALVKRVTGFVGNSSAGFIIVNIGCSKDVVRDLSPYAHEVLSSAMHKASENVKFVFAWREEGELSPIDCSSKVLVVKECTSELVSLLAHSKIRGLISLGDLLDVQEAIYHAVPLILLPLAFEQDANAERIKRLGRGIRLEITELDENDLTDAINSLLTNTTFKDKMKAASVMFRDRPSKPLDSALWWIDYTLRTSDMSLLKPLGIYDSWYARRSLDVWFTIFTSLSICSSVVISILLLFYCRNRKTPPNEGKGGGGGVETRKSK